MVSAVVLILVSAVVLVLVSAVSAMVSDEVSSLVCAIVLSSVLRNVLNGRLVDYLRLGMSVRLCVTRLCGYSVTCSGTVVDRLWDDDLGGYREARVVDNRLWDVAGLVLVVAGLVWVVVVCHCIFYYL